MKKFKKITHLMPKHEKRVRKAVLETGLFQSEWYCKQYPDVVAAGMDPLTHYIRFGDKAGRLPNPFFEPNYYRRFAPGAAKGDILSLLHYAARGWRMGRNPSAQFSPLLYRKAYPEALNMDADPLHYHLTVGQYTGKTAFPVLLEAEDKAAIVADMLTINTSGLFVADWYDNYYTDLWHAGVNPLYHFTRFGWRENRNPNPAFDTRWYKNTYSEQLDTGINPLVHYILEGVAAGNDPSASFSVKDYRTMHADDLKQGDDPLRHYLSGGLQSKTKITEAETGGVKLAKGSKLPVPQHLRDTVKYKPTPLSPVRSTYDPHGLVLHWIIPDFTAGGGGHMTIFRMIHFLEVAGHRQTIWINNPSLHQTPDDAYETIIKHFQHFAGKVKFIDDSFKDVTGDAVIATDCWTVAPALAVSAVQRRFYFVQDFEPSFHARGAHYLAAEDTYRQDLDCICAGPWLSGLMQKRYGRWARHFWLAADTRVYNPGTTTRPDNAIPRIAVYARHFTERRAVELAFLALELLAADGITFAVDFFGAPLSFSSAPFDYVDHGVASAETLADIFRGADVGLVFSATNYSLVPQEMMATGLPIVELDGESTRAVFPEGTVTFAAPHPRRIADAVAGLLASKKRRAAQAETASKWVQTFSWPASARLVEEALVERIGEFASAQTPPGETIPKASATKVLSPLISTPKASVVIPTYNAGSGFKAVLNAVLSQRTPWSFDVLVIDSGSTDGTLETVKDCAQVKLHEIDSKDFDHGDTRNLGVSLTSGDFIAFLTHDALPFNDRWLHNLVTAVEREPNTAGAFGKHVAYDDASPFTKRDLTAHFAQLGNHPLYLNRKTDQKRFDSGAEPWRQVLHFYSDNNSCMRRSVWEEIPYRKTAFGEDQLWADDIIKAGYTKAYAPQAVVFHSHDYGAAETYERAKIESAFFKHFFSYTLIGSEAELERTLEASNEEDTRWAAENRIDAASLKVRLALNEARLKGYFDGVLCDTSGMFD